MEIDLNCHQRPFKLRKVDLKHLTQPGKYTWGLQRLEQEQRYTVTFQLCVRTLMMISEKCLLHFSFFVLFLLLSSTTSTSLLSSFTLSSSSQYTTISSSSLLLLPHKFPLPVFSHPVFPFLLFPRPPPLLLLLIMFSSSSSSSYSFLPYL